MLQIDLCGGQVRVMLCETTRTVQRCADLHETTPVCTAALGRLMTGTVMLGIMNSIIWLTMYAVYHFEVEELNHLLKRNSDSEYKNPIT